MITVEVWARGYADSAGLTCIKLPSTSTQADIEQAVRKVGMFAKLAGVRRTHNSDLTPVQITALSAAFRGDNT